MAETNAPLAARLRASKRADAREAGAGCLCTACPYCQEQFAAAGGLEALLYPQVRGLALGLSPRALGLRRAPGPPVR
ncbi:MAG: hypothetical protein HY906_15650 [Deltaproteobacteria bacterium]|nr:hypothetical protein [Deltaproteobacteria bacterium]